MFFPKKNEKKKRKDINVLKICKKICKIGDNTKKIIILGIFSEI